MILQMKTLIIIDPLDTLNSATDSSLVMMAEATKRYGEVYICEAEHLSVDSGQVCGHIQKIKVLDNNYKHEVFEVSDIAVNLFDLVFIRKDPPFNENYLHLTNILDLLPKHVRIVNRPSGLRQANEKIFALQFPELMTQTIVSGRYQEIASFQKRIGKTIVLKPLDMFGGEGIVKLKQGNDELLRQSVATLSNQGRRLIMAQAFIESVYDGDKRIVLVGGEPVGAILRLPKEGDFRANLHAGGCAVATEITQKDRDICQRLRQSLLEHGLILVGVDLIGGFLTEINVTSPTCFQEIARTSGVHIEKRLFDYVEKM